jgi:AraC-like DNA-binding protein
MSKQPTSRPRSLAAEPGETITKGDVPLVVNWATPRASVATPLAHHREYEFHLVKRGTGAYFIRDRHVPFQRHSLLIIPPNVTHRFVPQPGTAVEKYTLMFWPGRFARAAGAFRLPPGLPCRLVLADHDVTAIELVFRALAYECEARRPFWREVLPLHLRHLFLLIRRVAREQARQGGAEERGTHALVSWCTTAIEKRFAEELSLQALARAAGYSLYHLAHLFKRETGLSVKQYILQRRIAEARRILLEQPGLTVDAVARQVGFSDFALFNRSFKKLTGQPPTLYRKFSHLNRND